jgi:polysaccharide export outer membrane protein
LPVLPAVSAADEELELAQALAARRPAAVEVIALARMVSATTPELGLGDVLSAAGLPAPPKLRVGDQILVTVFGRPELTGNHRIGLDGAIRLPLIGAIKTSGRSATELGTALQTSLERSYLHRALVTVRVEERAAWNVTVFGGVKAPGVYELSGERPVSLQTLLSRAQGFSAEADREHLTLLRTRDGVARGYHFGADELLRAHIAGREVWLEPEDKVVVPVRGLAYVHGAVEKPGRVPLESDSTVASVLLAAGWLTPEADAHDIRILNGTGSKSAAAVDLDTPVGAGMVVFVPRGQRVYVTGEVKVNGPVSLPRSRLTVLRALAEAGWFTATADIDGTRILRVTASGEPQTIRVPVSQILAGERPESDFPLLPGDLVTVPERVW